MSSAAAPALRFAAIGLDHVHILAQVGLLVGAGAELVAWQGDDSPLTDGFAKAFASAQRVADARVVLEDPSIALVTSAAVPDRRAALGLEVMRHGKDFLVDKPGAVTLGELEQLRAAQRETGRLWTVFFSERLANPATQRALALVRDGAIGRPIHTLGLGPHRLGLAPRPDWFWDRRRSGGILTDLASHQIDQFLLFTQSDSARVEAAQVANRAHPEHADFEDFGELLLRSEQASGYARVDWFTPDGLDTWGDVRLLVLGTEGTLEVRKNTDPTGRPGGNHLILVDAKGAHHFACGAEPLTFGPSFLDDVRQRTQKALPPEHCFLTMELALRAQALGATPARSGAPGVTAPPAKPGASR